MTEVKFPELKELLKTAFPNSVSQQELADWCSVKQSAVSQWIHGYNRPSAAHVALIASWEKINVDPAQLAQAAKRETEGIMRHFELISLGQQSFSDSLELHEGSPGLINKIWFRGDPELAIDEASIRIHQLEKNLEKYSAQKHRRPLLKILSNLWFERSCAYWVSAPISVSQKRIREMASKQYKIAEELDDKEPFGWAFHGLGNIFYGLKQFESSRESFNRALFYLEDRAYRRPLASRTVAITSAYLKDKTAFKEAVALTWDMLDTDVTTPATRCIVLEGIARGEAILGHSRARATLREGWSCLKQAETENQMATVPRIQLMRSEVEAALHLKDWDKTWIEKRSEEGKTLAEAHNYKKYAANFAEFLRNVAD